MGVKNFRRTNGKSNRMYCVRVVIQLMGEDAPKTRYLRFRPHGMSRGYSIWTENPKEAKFWLYRCWPDAWVMEHQHLRVPMETVTLHRDDEALKAQKAMR